MFEWWCQKIVFLNGGTSYCINNFRHETNIKRVNRALLTKPSSKHTCILTISYYISRGKNEFPYLKTTIRLVVKCFFVVLVILKFKMLHFFLKKKIFSFHSINQKKLILELNISEKTMQLILHMPRCMPACLIDNTLVLLRQYYL